jgi:hypothetical protein
VVKLKTKNNSLKCVVRSYIQSGYAPIPVPTGEKSPRLKGWPELRLREDDINHYFQRYVNVGLLLGNPSRGLVDVDIDALEGEVLEKYGAKIVLAAVENTDVTGLLDPSGCNHLNWVEEELCIRLDIEVP